MRKLFLIFYICSYAFALNVYSGGKLSPQQAAMDVTHYDIRLKVNPYKKTIEGSVTISFILLDNTDQIEIDLLKQYYVSGVSINGTHLPHTRNEHKIFIKNPGLSKFDTHRLTITYSGKPPEAKNPPWSGGFSWETSEDGYPWIGLSCQTNGAYIWYPCKEHPSDKPNGADIYITIPDPLTVAANGLLVSVHPEGDKWTTWHWKTEYPISTYNINFTAGYFEAVERTGYVLNKPIQLVYYVLPEQRKGAEQLLIDAEDYLNFYARHFGQYPWIKEKFGLVHTPYWGMEHQTINAYGNNYKKTKLGYDFLMFHEMGHEWWGNYLSVSDWSDFWIHEGFDTYAEALFVEEKFGKDAAKVFVHERYKKNIQNKVEVVPERNATTGFKKDNDVYYKGAHILHTLRYLIGDDILKTSLKEFIQMPKEQPQNQTSTQEFISLINENVGTDIEWFFNQYLFQPTLPTLIIEEEITQGKKFIDLYWKETDFSMPIEISFESFDGVRNRKLELTNSPSRIAIPEASTLTIDPDGWVLFNTAYEK